MTLTRRKPLPVTLFGAGQASNSPDMPAASIAGGFLAALCLAGGSAAGFRDDVPGERPGAHFWVAAQSVTLTLGIAGCLHVGLAGLAGMALGLAAGTLPVLAAHALETR
jgi:hypothetical protein